MTRLTSVATQQLASETVQSLLNLTALDVDECLSDDLSVTKINALSDKNYQPILKIILLPIDNFFDQLREKLPENNNEREILFSNCVDYFFSKKNKLTQVIKKSEKFNKWFERLLPMELDFLKLKTPLFAFSIDVAREKIEKNVALIDEMIQQFSDEPLLKSDDANAGFLNCLRTHK